MQAYFIIDKGDVCFADAIEAWDFGPVVPEVYQEYEKSGSCNTPEITRYLVFDPNDIWDTHRVPYVNRITDKGDCTRINDVVGELPIT